MGTYEISKNADAVNNVNLPDKGLSQAEIHREKRRIMKNIVLISLCFLLLFTSFAGLSRLQSSLHRDEGMGVITQSILYGAQLLSCLFLPSVLINGIGHKWTMPICIVGYILWMAANGYAVWGTMATSSVIVGLCAAPLWTAQSTYFTKCAARYAHITGELQPDVISRFFGIFFLFVQGSYVIGSVIIFTVLRGDVVNGTVSDRPCGSEDCPWYNVSNSNLSRPSENTVWTMLGIYIGISVLAVVIVCTLVDRLPRDLREPKVNKRTVRRLLEATIRQMGRKDQCLLIPITIYNGFEMTFMMAEFTQSFISCPLGISKVGLVTLPLGVVNAAVSFGVGHLTKYTGRVPISIVGVCVSLSAQLTMLLWLPRPDMEYVLYILSGLLGMSNGIWMIQVNALYGSIFTNDSEAAFSNYRVWQSVGLLVAFATSNFICTNAKLYIYTGLLVVGVAGYLGVEIMHRKQNDSQVSPTAIKE